MELNKRERERERLRVSQIRFNHAPEIVQVVHAIRITRTREMWFSRYPYISENDKV